MNNNSAIVENSHNEIIIKKSIWRNKDFLFLFIGNSISNLTFIFFSISIPILIYKMTSSSLAMSTMRIVEFLPNLFLAIFIGVIVDRLNRKMVIQISIVIQVICISIIIFLFSQQTLNLVYLYIIGFFLFIAGYTFNNAFHTILPGIVREDQLIDANASFSFVRTTIDIIGPSIAALIFLVLNYQVSLLITLAGLVILLFLIGFTQIPINKKKNSNDKTSMKEEIKEGWSHLISIKSLWIMTLMILFLNVVNGLTGAILIFYLLDTFKLSESEIALVMSFTGVGALFASIIAKKSLKYFKRGQLLIYSMVLLLIAHVMLYNVASLYILALAFLLIGFSGTFTNIHYLTLRQQVTPNHLLGRVAGTSSMIMKLAVPFAFFIGGILGEIMIVKNIFIIGIVILLLILIYGLKNKIYNIE